MKSNRPNENKQDFYIMKDKIILWKKLIGIEPFFYFHFSFVYFILFMAEYTKSIL